MIVTMALKVIPVPFSIFFLIVVCCNGTSGRIISNSSSLKGILQAPYLDTYECVDFYKQPAFDHPLLKNHTFDYKMTPFPYHEATSNDSEQGTKLVSIEFKGEVCPIGKVPIRRVAESYLPRKQVSDTGFYNAIARKKGTNMYIGAGGVMSLHNPKVTGQQYSAAKVKLQNGPDSIEAGWRVDPALYGDTQTRFYVFTDAGHSRCFNTLCPGFVLTSPNGTFETPLLDGPSPEGEVLVLNVAIVRDDQNNWRLGLGNPLKEFGYWPPPIFTALKDGASNIEWGGEVYDPSPTPTAEMGFGKRVPDDETHDAYFRGTCEYVKYIESVDANDIEAFSDSSFYTSKQYYLDKNDRRIVRYGGPN